MTTPSAASTLPKIAIISFENEAGTAVRADSYFATLESTYWKLSNYTDDIAGASLPNYCAVTSGSILNRTTDTTSTGTPPMPMNANNLYHQLEGAGLTWKSYAHGLSGTTDTATTYGGGLSIGKHDPASFYTTTKTSTNHTGFRSLVTDITNKTLPDFCFITPTLKEDGHDTNVAYASNWLQGKNPEAVASQEAFPGLDALLTAMGPAATVVIWWDEGSGGNDYSVVCGPNWVGHTVTASAMDHFRLLRSVQAAFNLTPFTTTGVTGTSIDARYSGSGTVLDLSVTPGGGDAH